MHRDKIPRTSNPTGTRRRSDAGILPFAAGSAGIALLLFTYYANIWGNFTNFQVAISTCAQPFCDFVDFYYSMGETVFRTGLPVPGFVYSPLIAILLAVFPPLGFNTSLVLWGVMQVICVILYLLLFRRLVPAGLPIQLLFVALALSSFPLLHNLSWGQVGIFTSAALLGMLFLYERGQHAAAAALFALAVSFKFYPLIFLAPFAARRDTRFLLYAAAACGTFLFVIPGVLLGVGDTLRFYGALLDAYREFDWVISNNGSQHFPHVLVRLVEATGHNAHAYLPLLRWISYSLAAANMGLLILIQRSRLHHANLWSFQLVFLTIPFVLYTSWPVDLVFLSFAQALLVWRLLEEERVTPGAEPAGEPAHKGAWQKRTPTWRVAVMFFLLLASIIFSNIVFFNLIGYRFSYDFYGFIFWADLLLLTASYVEFLPPALRSFRKPSAFSVDSVQ